MRNTASMGRTLTTDPAMRTSNAVRPGGPCRLLSMTGTVWADSEWRIVRGQRKLFQELMKKMIERLIQPGRVVGITIRQKMPISDAPSTLAASSISSGTDSMYWRMKKIPKAFAAPGTINGHGVSIQWKTLRIITKSGTITTANGSAMDPSMKLNRKPRPGKRNLANA